MRKGLEAARERERERERSWKTGEMKPWSAGVSERERQLQRGSHKETVKAGSHRERVRAGK